MCLRAVLRCALLVILIGQPLSALSHPLRLSVSEVEYSSDQKLLTISLRLFLMDVNEALVFDPDSTELAFCQPEEPPHAERLLMEYLNRFFHVKANDQKIDLQIKSKALRGEGDNTALWVMFEYPQEEPLTSLEIKNIVFTDLFYDQSNIIYLHVNGNSMSLMLNKHTPVHRWDF